MPGTLLSAGGTAMKKTDKVCSLNQVMEETSLKSSAGDRRCIK